MGGRARLGRRPGGLLPPMSWAQVGEGPACPAAHPAARRMGSYRIATLSSGSTRVPGREGGGAGGGMVKAKIPLFSHLHGNLSKYICHHSHLLKKRTYTVHNSLFSLCTPVSLDKSIKSCSHHHSQDTGPGATPPPI